MSTIGYLRVSTLDQDNMKFRDEILRYGNDKDLGTVTFVEEKISGVKDWRKRKLGEVIESANDGDKLIVPELSRLARSISQIYQIIEACRERHVGLHIIKQNIVVNGELDMQTKIMLNVFAMVSELERDFVSIRTKEALQARKKAGVKLGRPKGTSILVKHADTIKDLQKKGLNKTNIARYLGVSRNTLYNYLAAQSEDKK